MSGRSLSERFRAPYRARRPLRERWLFSLAVALFVFLFLFVFRPFGMSHYGQSLLLLTLGYGACTFIASVALNIAVPALVPAFFSAERWTVGREIAWNVANLLLIAALNVLYTVALKLAPVSVATVLSFLAFTLAVGVFPITLGVLWNAWRLEKSNTILSREMEKALHHGAAPGPAPVTIRFSSQNAKDDLEIPAAALLYCAGADNYVEIYWLEGGEVKRHLVRNTLRNLLDSAAGFQSLVRCHKSYLVNLDQVSHVSGNAQGCRLQLKAGGLSVPASRVLRQELAGRLAARP